MKNTNRVAAIKRMNSMKKTKLARERGRFMKFGAKLRAYLFTGILVTAPVAITFYMAYKFVVYIDSSVNKLIPPQLMDKYLFTIPGLGLILLLVAFTFIGWFAAGFMGRFFIKLGEWIVYKMPLISSVYSLLKQIFETFLSNKKQSFNKVVMVEYPRKGIWILGFLSGDVTKEIKKKSKEDLIGVFVLSTPNPTSGFLVFIPKKDVIELEMTTDEALKYIISCGIVSPEEVKKLKKK